jgi:hypothetical protein
MNAKPMDVLSVLGRAIDREAFPHTEGLHEAYNSVAGLIEDRARFNFMIEREYIVRKLSDTYLWMLLDRDGYPITGNEHDTAREAIDERITQVAALARVQGDTK